MIYNCFYSLFFNINRKQEKYLNNFESIKDNFKSSHLKQINASR